MNGEPAYVENALSFACGQETLLGIVAEPARPTAAADIGVLIIVGGPQYRAGSHRQFTRLARALASGGWPTLRFDNRGMGDSSGSLRNFEDIHDDIAAAIDALLRQQPQVRRTVLWALCDGASAALMYWHRCRDPRVAGLCLANPWVRSAQTLARARVKHYYVHRLMQPAFWRKLLGGRVAGAALGEWFANLRQSRSGRLNDRSAEGEATETFIEQMARGATAFDGPLLLLLSGNDYTAREFAEHAALESRWAAVMARKQTRRLDVPAADHTFSGAAVEAAALQATIAWLASWAASSAATASPIPRLEHTA